MSKPKTPTHFHHCPECNQDYPGYAGLPCKHGDGAELLCGKCLARQFPQARIVEPEPVSIAADAVYSGAASLG